MSVHTRHTDNSVEIRLRSNRGAQRTARASARDHLILVQIPRLLRVPVRRLGHLRADCDEYRQAHLRPSAAQSQPDSNQEQGSIHLLMHLVQLGSHGQLQSIR